MNDQEREELDQLIDGARQAMTRLEKNTKRYRIITTSALVGLSVIYAGSLLLIVNRLDKSLTEE